MAASIKVSELQPLTQLTDVDLFLVSDMESGTSRRVSYTDLHTNLTTDLQSALNDLSATVGQNRLDTEAQVTSLTQLINDKVAEVVDLAPENLNTLNELANALQDDPTLVTTIQSDLAAYKAHMDDINLQLALAYDVPTYIDTLQGG